MRKADWVCADLMAKLKECKEELVDEVPPLIETLEKTMRKPWLQNELEEEDEQTREDYEDRIARYFICRITDGLEHYVQNITNTPSVNAKAWPLSKAESEHILANPCIFHFLNLFFKGDKSVRSDPRDPIVGFEEIESWTKELEQIFTNVEVPRA